jgi:ribosome-interacting GTPase 1
MQLRSGRSTLTKTTAVTPTARVTRASSRRDSRNYEEFNERRRYQEEQKQLEDTIYEEKEDKQTPLGEKLSSIVKRMRHLTYLSNYQVQNKCTFAERIKTIKELYEYLLYNMDDLIEIFNGPMRNKKNLPEAIYRKGNDIRVQINLAKRTTRSEQQLAWECDNIIKHVTELIYRHILSTFRKG